eukprot:1097133-Rhodomonas_salina.1
MPTTASSAGEVMDGEPRRLTVKGPWTKEEDDVVIRLVGQYGPRRWSLIASNLPGRTGKQCRERWHNQLDPNINKEGWTEEEDYILAKAHTEVCALSLSASRVLPVGALRALGGESGCVCSAGLLTARAGAAARQPLGRDLAAAARHARLFLPLCRLWGVMC